MEFVSIPVPLDRVQEVYELLARRPIAASMEPGAPDAQLELVARVTRESPPVIRQLLSVLARRRNESVRFTEISDELGIPRNNLRAEMVQFSARWNDSYGQRGQRWF